jgi:ER lumen protein retaining receptor
MYSSNYDQPYPTSGGYPGSYDTHQDSSGKLKERVKDPLLAVVRWVKRRSPREKLILMGACAVLTILLLYLVVEDHDNLFVMAELIHFVGIGLLAWKLLKKKNAGGLSLRTQELTAIFLAVRLYCSFMMEYDVHTVLDMLTLVATAAVIYQLRVKLVDTYQDDQDSVKTYYVVIPCVALAALAHPGTNHPLAFRILWALCVYLEAVSVLPQLRMMQNAKVVEKFTAHYVFALGLSRFVSCAHWVLQIIDGDSFLLQAIGSGLWPAMVLLSEIVQTFILADFCFYYVKSYAEGTGVIHLPAGIV